MISCLELIADYSSMFLSVEQRISFRIRMPQRAAFRRYLSSYYFDVVNVSFDYFEI